MGDGRRCLRWPRGGVKIAVVRNIVFQSIGTRIKSSSTGDHGIVYNLKKSTMSAETVWGSIENGVRLILIFDSCSMVSGPHPRDVRSFIIKRTMGGKSQWS